MTDVYNSEGYSAKYQKYRPEYPTGVFQFFASYLQEKVGVRWMRERMKEGKMRERDIKRRERESE